MIYNCLLNHGGHSHVAIWGSILIPFILNSSHIMVTYKYNQQQFSICSTLSVNSSNDIEYSIMYLPFLRSFPYTLSLSSLRHPLILAKKALILLIYLYSKYGNRTPDFRKIAKNVPTCHWTHVTVAHRVCEIKVSVLQCFMKLTIYLLPYITFNGTNHAPA